MGTQGISSSIKQIPTSCLNLQMALVSWLNAHLSSGAQLNSVLSFQQPAAEQLLMAQGL